MSANLVGDRLVQSDDAEFGQSTLSGTRYGDLNQDFTVRASIWPVAASGQCCFMLLCHDQHACMICSLIMLLLHAQALQQLPATAADANGKCAWAAAVLDGEGARIFQHWPTAV